MRASTKQKTVRELYHEADLLWKDLTDGERNLWQAVKPYGHSAYSWFMHVNLIRANRGESLTRVPLVNKEG